MTSKNLYWAKWMENVRRRGWTFALCFVGLFLQMPAVAWIGLSSEKSYLDSLIAQGADSVLINDSRQRMQSIAATAAGFNDWYPVVAGLIAVLLAVHGFSFLYSRKKTDLYFSVPVSAPKRYVLIWGNGIFSFAVCYLVNLILCQTGAVLFGAMTPEGMAQSLVAFLVNLLAFAAMYQLALVAVMLTGNVLCALLGCAVLFFYEGAVRLLLSGLKSVFFFSYCSADQRRLMGLPWITPLIGFKDFCGSIVYNGASINSASPDSPWCAMLLEEVLLLILASVLFGVLAYFLYRRRKTESYHQTLAFSWMKPVLEFLLVVPFSVACGLLTGRMAQDFNLFLFGGALFGVLLGHGVIRLVYERDLKAVLQGRIMALCCFGAAVLSLCVFRFDLTGFDSWIPKREKIESVAFSMEHERGSFGWNQLSSDSVSGGEMLDRMECTDPDTIDALLSVISVWQEQQKREESDETAGEDWKDRNIWVVRYRLTDGRTAFRRFYVSREKTPGQLDILMRDPAYQDCRYQIYEQAMQDCIGEMEVSYTDGAREYFYTMDKEALLEALREDFRSYGSDLIASQLPCGALRLELPAGKQQDGTYDLVWEYPVYQTFEKTRSLLAKNDIDAAVTQKQPFLSANEVEKITVLYYHYNDGVYEDPKDDLFFGQEASAVLVPEQQITCVFTEKDEVEKLLEALYPGELISVAAEAVADPGVDYRFDVRISLTPEALKDGYREGDVYLIRDREPDFLEKAVREAAVFG